MAVEYDTKIDKDSLTVPALHTNRVQVTGLGPILRISFGEQLSGDTPIRYNSAVVLSIADAKDLADLLLACVMPKS